MAKLACWELIKQGCNASQLDSLAAFNAQQDALWYEGRIKQELPEEDQERIAAMATQVATASDALKKKAEKLRAFVKAKAEAEAEGQ